MGTRQDAVSSCDKKLSHVLGFSWFVGWLNGVSLRLLSFLLGSFVCCKLPTDVCKSTYFIWYFPLRYFFLIILYSV